MGTLSKRNAVPPSTGPAASPSHGRPVVPRGDRRRREIAAVAEGVFLAQGYEATTMLMVARSAGASKVTLYRHFGSKEDLFAEVIRNRAATLNAGFAAVFGRGSDLPAVLRDVGITLLTEFTSSAVVQLLRMVAAETSRDPELGRVLHAHGPATGEAYLTEYLGSERAKGTFPDVDVRLAANLFISAVTGHVLLDVLFLVEADVITASEIERRVDAVVEMFMARYEAAAGVQAKL